MIVWQDNEDLRSIAASATARAALIEREAGTLRRCNRRFQRVKSILHVEGGIYCSI
jgi:hypothetical protein